MFSLKQNQGILQLFGFPEIERSISRAHICMLSVEEKSGIGYEVTTSLALSAVNLNIIMVSPNLQEGVVVLTHKNPW